MAAMLTVATTRAAHIRTDRETGRACTAHRDCRAATAVQARRAQRRREAEQWRRDAEQD